MISLHPSSVPEGSTFVLIFPHVRVTFPWVASCFQCAHMFHSSAADLLNSFPIHEHDHDSILSSLTPSQSASQMGINPHSASLSSHEKPFRLNIPPPHLLSEHTAIPGPTMYTAREMDYAASSSEDEGPVEVVENPRFQPSSSILHRQRSRTAPSTPARSSPVPFSSPSQVHGISSDVGPPTTSTQGKYGRDRKGAGFFGSIALLFRTSMNSKSSPSQRWSTRTDHNVRNVRTDGENSSEDEPRAGRLRKGKARSSFRDSVERDNATQFSAATPLHIKNKTSGGKLNRSSAGSSTVNETAPVQRLRANTLTPSSGRIPDEDQGKPFRSHRRRASMDGRWGLSDEEPKSSSSTPVWKLPKQSTGNKGSSLMSIVEGVSHSNDDPSSRLEVVRAPGNEPPELPVLVHHPPPLPSTASAPASLVGTSVAQKRTSMPNPPAFKPARDLPPAPARKPLRSALRSPDRGRSVSPLPGVSTPNGNVVEEAGSATMSPLTLPAPVSLAPPSPTPALSALASTSPTLRPLSMSRPEIPSTIMESPRQSVAIVDTMVPQTNGQAGGSLNINARSSMAMTDTASISSYETGHETFDDDEVVESGLPLSAPPIPPTSEQVVGLPSPSRPNISLSLLPNGTVSESLGVDNKHEISSATSTETPTGATATRRKSVRMSSLPPQVSATPPALDDENDDRAPWGRSRAAERDEGWKTRISETGGRGSNAWDDSSSEDEVYKRAWKALSRVERQLERKTR